MKNRNLVHSDNWKTPFELLNKLDEEFNFEFDPCPLNHDLDKWDGLKVDWRKSNFINPPYRRKTKEAFIRKAVQESRAGKVCVMLLPVSTSTAIFHDWVKPNAKEIRFIRKRVRFSGYNTKGEYVEGSENPMHDSMVVVFDGR